MKEKATLQLINLLGENKNVLDVLVFELLLRGIIESPKNEKMLWAAFINAFKEVKSLDEIEYKRFQFYMTEYDINYQLTMIELLDTMTVKSNETERISLLLKSFDLK